MKKYIPIALSIFIAFVFLQSLPFKFTNSLETQHIFTTLAAWSGLDWFGVYGGYMVGGAELITAILLFTKLRSLAAIMALGIMSGAIFFHLFTPLGIVMPHFDAATAQKIGDDSGVLFIMACITWTCAVALALLESKNPESTLSKVLAR
ncbi:MAG: hypothetical protein ACI9NY_001595 [Kiritimatiellia bacterium]|jgi:hypothetical protein